MPTSLPEKKLPPVIKEEPLADPFEFDDPIAPAVNKTMSPKNPPPADPVPKKSIYDPNNIKLEDFKPKRKIGEGRSSKVLLTYLNDDENQPFVIKVISPDLFWMVIRKDVLVEEEQPFF